MNQPEEQETTAMMQSTSSAKTFKGKQFWRKGGDRKSQPKAAQRPELNESRRPDLKPKHLSTTASTEHNDPLSKEEFLCLDGLAGFQEIRQSRYFQLDYSNFIGLVRKSYDTQIHYDRSLQKYVSYSMWQYYCVIMLWKRIYVLMSQRGYKTNEVLLLEGVLPDSLVVPDDINAYLNGIGDFRDQDGRMNLLALQGELRAGAQERVNGWFGPVGPNNHFVYETLPCPGVAYRRIERDFLLTHGVGEVSWDLPIDIRPNVEEQDLACQPTANLLGWGLAVVLTTNQRDALASAGFAIHNQAIAANGSRSVANIPINQELISAISQYLQSSKFKCFGAATSGRNGSLAQVPFTTRVPEDIEPNRFITISQKDGITQSTSQFGSQIAGASCIFRYRLDRTARGARDWCSYEFHHIGEEPNPDLIPRAWLDNANSVFNYGIGGMLWNVPHFNIGQMNGLDLLTQTAERARNRAIRK